MKSFRLEDMIKGWFVGSFSPSVFATNDCEVAIKKYTAGMYEPPHFHKIATEITAVIGGTVKMAGKTWEDGDIILLEPGTVTDFEAVTDVTTVVVKVPGSIDDKYLID